MSCCGGHETSDCLRLVRCEPWRQSFQICGDPSRPLTSGCCVLEFTVSRVRGGEVVYGSTSVSYHEIAIVSDEAFFVSMTAEDTADLCPGKYYWQVRRRCIGKAKQLNFDLEIVAGEPVFTPPLASPSDGDLLNIDGEILTPITVDDDGAVSLVYDGLTEGTVYGADLYQPYPSSPVSGLDGCLIVET